MKFINNKRKFERLRTINLNVLFSRDWNEISTQVEVLNVSLGGICLLSKSALRLEEKLLITFPFKTKFIVLNSVVAWVLGREVGVEFLEKQKRIVEFMEIFNREYPSPDSNSPKYKSRLVAPLDYINKQKYEKNFGNSGFYKLADYN